MANNMMMFEEEQGQIQSTCDQLSKATNALAVLCIDKNGQEIARAGTTEHLDITSLSSLFAGNVGCLLQIAKHLKKQVPAMWVAHPIDALWASYTGVDPRK